MKRRSSGALTGLSILSRLAPGASPRAEICEPFGLRGCAPLQLDTLNTYTPWAEPPTRAFPWEFLSEPFGLLDTAVHYASMRTPTLRFRQARRCAALACAAGTISACSNDGGPLSPADLDGRFEVVAASDSKGNSVTIHLPDRLPPNTYVVLVNELRDRLIMPITPQEERPDAEGRIRITISGTKIRLQRPPGQTVLTTTHGMLVGFPGGSPAKDELEKIIPSPFSTREASDQAVLEALHDRADDIRARFPGCVVRIEAFDVRTGNG